MLATERESSSSSLISLVPSLEDIRASQTPMPNGVTTSISLKFFLRSILTIRPIFQRLCHMLKAWTKEKSDRHLSTWSTTFSKKATSNTLLLVSAGEFGRHSHLLLNSMDSSQLLASIPQSSAKLSWEGMRQSWPRKWKPLLSFILLETTSLTSNRVVSLSKFYKINSEPIRPELILSQKWHTDGLLEVIWAKKPFAETLNQLWNIPEIIWIALKYEWSSISIESYVS